ncbi:glycosyltransferase family 9 protein [Halomonas mongoliensis]|uniref:glycosyltransferase family 9 protein n=1 Tax=Halomonas mongoliensis TaxID=321265 RepID=UPI00403AB9DE
MSKWNKRLGRRLLERWYDYDPDTWQPESIRKAVIFTPKAIGDSMGTYPVIRALQELGTEWIGVVASARSAPIFEGIKSKNIEIFTIDHDRDYSAIKKLAKHLQSHYGQVDLCVDATAIASSPSIYFVGTLKARMNLQVSNSKMKAFVPVSRKILDNWSNVPTVKSWAHIMESMGVAKVPGKFELPIPRKIEQEIQSWISPLGDYLLFNLDGSSEKRRISLDKARALLPAAHSAMNCPIVVPYDPRGKAKAKQLASEFDFIRTLPESTSILHSAALIKHSQVLFSPDTSLIHIASAYNIPTLGVYSTQHLTWRPQASISDIIVVNSSIDKELTEECVSKKLLKIKESIFPRREKQGISPPYSRVP